MKLNSVYQRAAALLLTLLGSITLGQTSNAAIILTLTQDGSDVLMTLGGQTHVSTATSNLGPGSGSSFGQLGEGGEVFLFGTIGFQGQYNFVVAGTITDWLLLNTQTVNVVGNGAFGMSSGLLSFGGVGVTPTGFFDYNLDATKQSLSARVPNALISDMTNTPSGTTIWTGGGGEVILNIGTVPESSSTVMAALSCGGLLMRRRGERRCMG